MNTHNVSQTHDVAHDTEADHRFVRIAIKRLRATDQERNLKKLLGHVRSELEKHFASEERPAKGLFATIVNSAPRHAHAVDDLRQEHTRMLDEARRFLGTLTDAPTPLSTTQRKRVAAFASRLEGHERREQGLLQDMLERDLEGGN
jgi:ABC-type molybdenum transport system ATPase subunit/photorepair protein PhrA